MQKIVEIMISIMPKMDALFLVVEYWKSEQQDMHIFFLVSGYVI